MRVEGIHAAGGLGVFNVNICVEVEREDDYQKMTKTAHKE